MTLTGLILAGGLSSRMGRDKATLLIDGQPLWARQLAVLRKLNAAAILVSARSLPTWLPPDSEVLIDMPPSQGPISGLAAALTRMSTTHLVALAVDLPQLTAEHLWMLVRMSRPGCGVIPLNENHYEPLAAIYPKQAASLAEEALRSTDWSLQSLSKKLKKHDLVLHYPVPTQERRLYRNLNTPEDLLYWST